MTARRDRCIVETLPAGHRVHAVAPRLALSSALPVARCAHDLPPPAMPRAPSVLRRRKSLTSNVGQNYPYTSESEAQRVAVIGRLLAERADLGPKISAETTPFAESAADPADEGDDVDERWWVWKCPT